MKTWSTALMAAACLLGGGCRIDPAIVLLERENRMLEDEIYRLRGVIEDYQQGLAPTCGEFVEGGASCIDSAPMVSRDAGRDDSTFETQSKESAEPYLSAPNVVSPSKSEPPGDLPEIFRRPAGEPPRKHEGIRSPPPSSAPPWKPDLGTSNSMIFPTPPTEERFPVAKEGDRPIFSAKKLGQSPGPEIKLASAEEPVPFDDSREASAIKLYRGMTGGYDFDERSGDEGVQVVFEIQDRRGRSLLAPADVSMVLYDPAAEGDVKGEAARIARWDFPAETTAELFRTDGRRKALFLEAPWPDEVPPKHDKLQLFVRYTTWDGRNLQAGQPIEITLPGRRKVRDHAVTPRKEASRLTAAEKTDDAPADTAGRPDVEAEEPDSAPRAAERTTLRTASQENAPSLPRPVWKPTRR
ncbi:MAG: hypothetical protein JXB10_04000 [Pirellulales bacterium]|nr:hypothetical protein [Pirellulales bacterium]